MKKMAYALLALAGVAGLAQAADSNGATGVYGGVSVGAARDRSDSPVAPTDRSATSYNIYGGYSFTPNLAVELGYTDLGRFDTTNGGLKARGTYADVVGKLPIADKFSLLGRVGAFNGHLKDVDNVNGNVSDSGTRFKIGAGLQYDLTSNVALRGEWNRYKFNTSAGNPGINDISAGLNFKF
ncbi:MAG TPA: outer membrane beta-barrel protein [Burkholderiaceae bacterium]